MLKIEVYRCDCKSCLKGHNNVYSTGHKQVSLLRIFFYFITHQLANKLMFVHGRHLRPSLMFKPNLV